MQVKSIGQNIGSAKNINQRTENIQTLHPNTAEGNSVSFTGLKPPNAIVGLMDFIAAGGFAASFCIQDGIGFIAPRVGKGLLRGGKKKHDENGNEILDKKGEPKRELNWAYARKEGLREVITGPSAFIIPYFLLKGINKKFGSGNSVRLDYIDGFKNKFTTYVKDNLDAIKNGEVDKKVFYKEVFKDVIDKSINNQEGADKIACVDDLAEKYAQKQVDIDEAMKIKNKAERQARLNEIGSLEDDFIKLRKKHVGGAVNDVGIEISASNGKLTKHGTISELTKAMRNYFDDAIKNVHQTLKKTADANVEDVMKNFTGRKMGSRLLTNLGLFSIVALFYTQIPKLYNMGTGGKNPALMNDEEPALAKVDSAKQTDVKSDSAKKDVSFGGAATVLEKAGHKVFNSKKMKKISDIFELNGPIIQGNAMAVLLYAACIPPRLRHAQDKYDFGEILVRDMTAFTALLFGAKALARLFSDGFTKMTGLALNNKNMEGRNFLQKTWDYLNPSDARHSLLSSQQLESKYTDLKGYKGEVDGFIEFIEKSGGNIKKALGQDKNIKNVVEDIIKDIHGKSFAEATKEEVKSALHAAKELGSPKLDKFYELFKGANGLLNKAKTCNSAFGALSTLLLVPMLIISLTDYCEHLTQKRQAKEREIKTRTQAQQAPLILSNKPSMAGFLNKEVA